MAAMNHNCRLTEKDEYWKESPTDQFFKFMVGGFRDSLRIPRSNFRENLSGTIRLRGPSGFIWTVELEKKSDHVVFLKGWDKFVKDHSLANCDMLVFRYDINSTFNVTIFNSNGCVRQGTYFVNQHDACSNDRCKFQKQDDKENHMQNKRLRKEKGNPTSKAVPTPSRKKQPQVGISEAATSEEIVVLEDDSEQDSVCVMEASEERRKEYSVSLKGKSRMKQVKTKGPPEFPGSYQMRYKSNRRAITEKEKLRPQKLADEYSSTRPFFSLVMKPTHVCKGFVVFLRKRWLVHISDNVEEAHLKVPRSSEKIWPVGTRNCPNGRRMLVKGMG